MSQLHSPYGSLSLTHWEEGLGEAKAKVSFMVLGLLPQCWDLTDPLPTCSSWLNSQTMQSLWGWGTCVPRAVPSHRAIEHPTKVHIHQTLSQGEPLCTDTTPLTQPWFPQTHPRDPMDRQNYATSRICSIFSTVTLTLTLLMPKVLAIAHDV